MRATAAKYAHICQNYKNILSKLENLLHDENYNVRFNAASTLVFFEENGLKILENNLTSSDRFSRDISKYFLEKITL